MLDLLASLFSLLVWGGSLALLAWWLWTLRRAGAPSAPRAEDQAELARLREHLGLDAAGTTGTAAERGRPTA